MPLQLYFGMSLGPIEYLPLCVCLQATSVAMLAAEHLLHHQKPQFPFIKPFILNAASLWTEVQCGAKHEVNLPH
jgi:hypothetical protein